MKILVPYYSRSGISIDSPIILGGLEKFAQLLYKHIDGVIPIEFTDEDRKTRSVTSKVIEAAKKHNVDIILSNYENATLTTHIQSEVNIPVMWISHSCSGGIGRLSQIEYMWDFVDRGGILYMMSENQYNGLNQLSKRVNNGKTITLTGGYLNSAFCSGLETPSKEIDYEIITIGRLNKEKNPFWVHSKLKGSTKHSLVLSSKVKEFMSHSQLEYYDKNSHWGFPQETIYDLPHKKVMEKLSKSGCYVSTHPRESWGITALEALSHGLPTFLITDSTGIHSSEVIPADPSHIQKIHSGIKQSEMIELINQFNSYSHDQRLEISELTKEKHSLNKWKLSIEAAIDKTISLYKPQTKTFDLSSFLV